MIALHHHGVGVVPDFPPIIKRKAAQGVAPFSLVIVEHIDTAMQHGWTRVTFAQIRRPDDWIVSRSGLR